MAQEREAELALSLTRALSLRSILQLLRTIPRALAAPFIEFWRHYPAWFFVIAAQSMLATAISQTGQATSPILLIFPLSWVALYYFVRVKWDAGITHKVRAYLIFVAVVAVIIGGTYIPGTLQRISPDTVILYDEISTYILVGMFAVHSLVYRGKHDTIKFFVIALLFGCMLETSGVGMGFFREDHYHTYVPYIAAPLCTMLGWSDVFYPTTAFVRMLRRQFTGLLGGLRGIFVQAAASATCALFLDLQIDPVAKQVQLWVWNPGLVREQAIAGVPIINFIAWFWACFAFALAYYWVESRPWSQWKKIGILAASLPADLVVAGLLVMSTSAIVSGPHGPSVHIFTSWLFAFIQHIPL